MARQPGEGWQHDHDAYFPWQQASITQLGYRDACKREKSQLPVNAENG